MAHEVETCSHTLVLFLSLNHRRRSHTRTTTAQCGLHVSAPASHHITAESETPLKWVLTHRAWAWSSDFRIDVSLFVIAPGRGARAEGEWQSDRLMSAWLNLSSFTVLVVTKSEIHSVRLTRTLAVCVCLCVTWVWIPVAMWCSSWALKPQRGVLEQVW